MASLDRGRCFQKARDRKDQGFSLVQLFMGVMKGEVWLTGCVRGERRSLKRRLERVVLAGRIVPPSETKHLHLSSSGVCHRPPFICGSPVLTLVNDPPGELLVAWFWSQATWHTSGQLPGQWACVQRVWIPLSRNLSKMSRGSKSSFKKKKASSGNQGHGPQKRLGAFPKPCYCHFHQLLTVTSSEEEEPMARWRGEPHASFPPLPFVTEHREREWDLMESIHSFIPLYLILHSLNIS